MSKVTLNFIRASLIYLVAGSLLGTLFFMFPHLRAYRFAHAHLNLLGFMAMMIYGVAYHILPRFRGKPLHSDRLAEIHFWTANLSLMGLALFGPQGLLLRGDAYQFLAAGSGALQMLSILLFVYNLWVTLA